MNSNHQSILDSVAKILESPQWRAEVLSFIDEHCIVFDGEEENSLEHWSLYNEFVQLAHRVLLQRLEEKCITEESLANACYSYQRWGKENGEMKRKGFSNTVVDQLLAFDDFLVFKMMMLNRNMELEMEVIKKLELKNESDNEGNMIWSSSKATPLCLMFENTITSEVAQSIGVEENVMPKRSLVAEKDYHKGGNNDDTDFTVARKEIIKTRDDLQSEMGNAVEEGSQMRQGQSAIIESKSEVENENEELVKTNARVPRDSYMYIRSNTGSRNRIQTAADNANDMSAIPKSLERKKEMIKKHNEFIQLRKAKIKKNKHIDSTEQDRRQLHFRSQRDLIHARRKSNRTLELSIVSSSSSPNLNESPPCTSHRNRPRLFTSHIIKLLH